MPTNSSQPLFVCVPCDEVFEIPPGILGPTSHTVRCPSGAHEVIIVLPPGSKPLVTKSDPGTEKAPIAVYPPFLFRNPLLAVVGLVGVFLTIVAGFASVAMLVPPVLCPLVLAAAIVTEWLLIILVLAMYGVLKGNLITDAFGEVGKFLSRSFGGKPRSGHVGN